MSFISVAAGQPIRATHVQQFTNWLTAQKLDTPGTIACTSTSEFALTVRSQEGTTGLALAVQYGSASSPTTLAYFTKDASRLSSSDGTDYLQITNSGVAVTGSFTVNGSSVSTSGSGAYRVYSAADTLVTGTTVTNASANTLAFQTLYATAASEGGGRIFFPRGSWPLNATVLTHTAASTAIIIEGEGRASVLYFFGTTGPFLQFGSTATSVVNGGGIANISLMHSTAVSAGATVKLGGSTTGTTVANFQINDIAIINRGRPDAGQTAPCEAALIGVESAYGFEMHHSKIELRTDLEYLTAASLFPIGIHMIATSTSAGMSMLDTTVDGCYGRSYGIRFANSGLIDTPRLGHCLIKDHAICILKNSGAGQVVNAQIGDTYLDVCDKALLLEPTTGASVGAWHLSNTWMSAFSYAVTASIANGGTVGTLNFDQGYITNSTVGAFLVGSGVTNFSVSEYDIALSGLAVGERGCDFGGATGAVTNLRFVNNTVTVSTGATSSVRIGSGSDPVLFTGNILRGATASFLATTSASVINANNAFKT